MRIIPFITKAVDVRVILEHMGEPAIPPQWHESSVEDAIHAEE